MVDIQHLKYYVAIVERESFTKAADALYVSQPMLTKAVRQLEAELEATLIVRNSKSFSLTDAGVHFYKEAKSLLSHFQDMRRSVDDLKSGLGGHVQISLPGVLLDTYFPKLLLSFHQQYPNIKISVDEDGSKKTAAAIRSGQADVGLVMLPLPDLSPFSTYPLVHDVCRLLVPKTHPLAKSKAISLQQLQDERIILFNDSSILHDAFIQLCAQEGFSPNIAYKSFMPNFIFDMVRQELCVAVLPAPIIERYLTDDFAVVDLTPTIQWHIAAITKQGHYLSFAARKLLSHIETYFANL